MGLAIQIEPEELFENRDDPETRDLLIEHYLTLAETLARRYRHAGQPYDDLVQVASIGLIKAIDRFDPSRGVNFESYAIPTILGELKRFHRDKGWSVRVPRQLQENALRIKEVVPLLAQELRRAPTIAEVGEHAGLTEEGVLEALDAQDAYTSISLDMPPNENGQEVPLAERLSIDDDEIDLAERWVECEQHLQRLPSRQRKLIELRFFRDRTQSEIAQELGISQMHVSRLLSQTIEDLRLAVGVA